MKIKKIKVRPFSVLTGFTDAGLNTECYVLEKYNRNTQRRELTNDIYLNENEAKERCKELNEKLGDIIIDVE